MVVLATNSVMNATPISVDFSPGSAARLTSASRVGQ